MSTFEEVKKLCDKPYDSNKLDEYQRIMMESVDGFSEVVDEADKWQRQSPEYICLTQYHIASHKGNEDYRKVFDQVVEKFVKAGKR